MQGFTALSMLVITVVSLVVGMRLVLVARRTRELPELAFGIAFLSGAVGSAGGQIGRRLFWSESSTLATTLNAGCFALLVIGTIALLVASWRIWRPEARWAASLCGGLSALVVVAFTMRLASGDFATSEIGSSGMALYFACRAFAFLWTTIEAFLYHAQLRRRLSLGLADPLVAGQILLWGISGASAVGLTAVISTSIFALGSHPFEIPGVMALVTVFALTTGASMYGAFFPPAFLRRRMASGATTPGS